MSCARCWADAVARSLEAGQTILKRGVGNGVDKLVVTVATLAATRYALNHDHHSPSL